MAHKTKAAMQGRQCHYQKLKQGQNTRGNAGGQRISGMHFCILGTAPLAGLNSAQFLTPDLAEGRAPMERLNHNLMISKQSLKLSREMLNPVVAFSLHNAFRCAQTPDLADGYPVPVKSSGCADLQLAKGCLPLAHTPVISRSFEPAKTGEVKSKVGFRRFWRKPVKDCAPQNGGANKAEVFTETGRNSNRYPDIGYHPSSASLAFLRCRRFISPLIEATTKPAVLSPSSFNFSSSPINSNGTLETICCDLLFLEPVAISAFPSDWWHSVYAKRKHNQYLKVAFTLLYGKCMPPVMVKHKWQRPGVLGTTAEASNHNVSRSNDHG